MFLSMFLLCANFQYCNYCVIIILSTYIMFTVIYSLVIVGSANSESLFICVCPEL